MESLKIAVIGAGMAGLAAASFLKGNGHAVSLYEKFEAPKHVGAGLLLQPTGLSILALLGLDYEVIASGSQIDHLDSRACGSSASILDVRYRDVALHLFGLGVHRADLFSALYEAALRRGVTIVPSREITEWREGFVRDSSGVESGPFDLVIDASGARSILRRKYADIRRDRPYPYGALWAVVRNDGVFPDARLLQRCKQATHMIGVLPVGGGRAAFFYSLRAEDYEGWREKGIHRWREEVVSLWPETEPLVTQLRTSEDMTLATYSDTVLRKFHVGRLVFVGDAAHCTSPQLGQGGNLALMDAWVLSECLKREASLEEALAAYETARRTHVRFYQTASRMLTPFFQSDSRGYAMLRAVICNTACRIPLGRRIAAQVLSGTKTGIFRSLNPGEWAEDYGIFSALSNARTEA